MKPLPLPRALLLFALTAVPFWLSIHWAVPRLIGAGSSVALAFSIGVVIPLAVLLAVAVLMGMRERGSVGLLARWRLKRMRRSDWGWTLVLLVITLAGYFLLSGTSDWLGARAPFIPPAELDLIRTDDAFFGIPLKGNWWALVVHVGLLVMNVFGEELWFRGTLFPRQEAAHGKHAWWIHGLCYHAWHMFYPWDLLRLLPESLAYGWVTQKTGNTWPAIISHFAFNGLGLLATVGGIVG
jgi:membrane protease YdiL (CAAX protease family)